MREKIVFKIIEMVKNTLSPNIDIDITIETFFDKNVSIDSIDLMRIVVLIEEEFDIYFGDDVPKVNSVKELVDMVELKINEKNRSSQ